MKHPVKLKIQNFPGDQSKCLIIYFALVDARFLNVSFKAPCQNPRYLIGNACRKRYSVTVHLLLVNETTKAKQWPTSIFKAELTNFLI